MTAPPFYGTSRIVSLPDSTALKKSLGLSVSQSKWKQRNRKKIIKGEAFPEIHISAHATDTILNSSVGGETGNQSSKEDPTGNAVLAGGMLALVGASLAMILCCACCCLFPGYFFTSFLEKNFALFLRLAKICAAVSGCFDYLDLGNFRWSSDPSLCVRRFPRE